jgi:nucleoside-diphosphate-sugar epimerase
MRFPSLFGPWKGDTSTGNEIFRRLIESALIGGSTVIDNPFPGHSEQLYIKDVTNAVVLGSDARRLKHKVFNIGSGRMNSYEEALEITRKILPKVNIELRDIESVVDIRNQPLDITLAREELGYTPKSD